MLSSEKMRKQTPVNLLIGLASRLSRRISYERDFLYGKVYGTFGLCDEVGLAIDTVNAADNPDSTVLDLGANKGDYSALIATRLRENSLVHCFAPSTNHRKSLLNLQERYKDKIRCYPFGLFSNEGTTQLFKDI